MIERILTEHFWAIWWLIIIIVALTRTKIS